MKRVLPAFALFLVVSGAAWGDPITTGDVTISFLPTSTQVYPPGAAAFECQLGGGAVPCVIFSGTITDTDTDGSFITLAADPTISAYSDYFTVDNTFFDTTGFYEGDTDNFVTSNTYGSGLLVFGLDIAPGTPDEATPPTPSLPAPAETATLTVTGLRWWCRSR